MSIRAHRSTERRPTGRRGEARADGVVPRIAPAGRRLRAPAEGGSRRSEIGDAGPVIRPADVVVFVRRAADVLRRHEALLDRLDAALGDGDHGTNMRTGFEAAAADLEGTPPSPAETPGVLLRRVGHVLLESVGGASGPLYATAFIEAGFAMEGSPSADLRAIAGAMDAGARGLARRGRCSVGDKTILDAMRPATDALLGAVEAGRPPGAAFEEAARAARGGVLATIPLVARRGLALRLGERSRGHRDPGAVSCFLLVRAMLSGRQAGRRGGAGPAGPGWATPAAGAHRVAGRQQAWAPGSVQALPGGSPHRRPKDRT